MRQSDYGLDQVGTIVDTQLKSVDFLTVKVADALEVIKADIVKEIMCTNRGCSAADLVFFFSENFIRFFTQGALLIAECLDDYYHGNLVHCSQSVGYPRYCPPMPRMIAVCPNV